MSRLFHVRRRSRRQHSVVIGDLDSPHQPVLARLPVLFQGWALQDGLPISKVHLVVDETTLIPARTGIERRDVPENLRLPQAATDCGWAVSVDLGPWPEGPLHVQVVSQDAAGLSSVLVDRRFELRDAPQPGNGDDPGRGVLPAPEWPWQLPEAMAETAAEVIAAISHQERMPADESYPDVGRSALKAIRLALLAAGVDDPRSILDMPCGHGRVLRWLKAAYPSAQLTACDLIADGVDFCAVTFGATPVYSSPLPSAAAFANRYDLIFVGSLLTHVDVPQWDHLIKLWHDLLDPDGVLVVTTHGEMVAERMRSGHHYGYPATGIRHALRAYDHSGFAFLEEPFDKVDYGITIAKPDWVVRRLLVHSDFRLVLFSEALWHSHQDVVAVVKRPLRAAS